MTARALDEAVKTETEARQRAAADPSASAWVSANAGAGKTTVLTRRVARLLLAGARPERIVCVTYTETAAAEMRLRLFALLGAWSMMETKALEGELAAITGGALAEAEIIRARRLFAEALETPGGLKITTIHAFCARILRRFPAEAGVPAAFTVLDDIEREGLVGAAIDSVLQAAAQDPKGELGLAAQHLVSGAAERSVRSVLTGAFSRRALIERMARKAGAVGGMKAAVRHAFGLDPDDDEASIFSDFLASRAHDEGAIARAAAAHANGTERDGERGALLLRFIGAADRRAAFAEYTSFFLIKSGAPKKTLVTIPVKQADPGAEEVLAREQARVDKTVRRLEALRRSRLTEASLAIALPAFEDYERRKQARGALDFDDLVDRTQALLSSYAGDQGAWVHFKLDEGISHVLLDEAQDTSVEAWEILSHLTEGFFDDVSQAGTRTMFAVGDEKQSIYSFQGAVPRQFTMMRERTSAQAMAAERRFHAVTLDASFRSAPEILAAVDRTFEHPELRAALSSAGGQVKHVAALQGLEGTVELWPPFVQDKAAERTSWKDPVDTQGKGAAASRLARAIASEIAAWTGAENPQRIDPGDVLILVRRRKTVFYELLRALRRAGVPTAGSDRLSLAREPAFLDLMALARFAALPTDDLALAEVLRSPLIEMSEERLAELAIGRRGNLWTALRQAEGTQESAAVRLLSRVIDLGGAGRLFEMFLAALDGQGGARRRFLERLGLDCAEAIEETLSLALAYEGAESPSLTGFLDWMVARSGELKRDVEEAGGKVRLMTIHRAKGLESPVVILADAADKPRARSANWLFDPDADLALRAGTETWDDLLSARLKSEARAREAAEGWRLLYVAMTRAKQKLIVTGTTRPGDEALAGTWYEAVRDALKADCAPITLSSGESALRFGRSAKMDGASGGRYTDHQAPAEIPNWLTEPPPAEEVRLRRTPSGMLAEEEHSLLATVPLAAGGEGRDPTVRGRLVHRLLERLPDLKPGDQAGAAVAFLRRSGLEEAEARALAAETLAVIADPSFADVFSSKSRAEVPVAGLLKGSDGREISVSGQIDRLLIDDDRVLIVDFKTGSNVPEDAHKVQRAYLAQMAVYRLLLQQILPSHTVGAALLFTAAPRLIPLPGPLLDVTAVTSFA